MQQAEQEDALFGEKEEEGVEEGEREAPIRAKNHDTFSIYITSINTSVNRPF